MRRWRGLDAAPGSWGRSVVTIGVFDGVHRGHQATIGHAVKRASDLGVQSVVLTFDPHPAEVVRPGSHPAVLTEPGRKAELIEQLGVDVLCVLPFTPEFSRLPAEEFVHDVLVERLHAALVVVGDNFRFGHRAAGDSTCSRGWGGLSGSGWRLRRWWPRTATVFSSTYIRVLRRGRGRGRRRGSPGPTPPAGGRRGARRPRGRELGFPTANVLPRRYAAVPADGVYAAWLIVAAASGSGRRVDRHQPDLLRAGAAGRGVRARLRRRSLRRAGGARLRRPPTRECAAYTSVEPLVAQIREDVAQTRAR